MEHVGEDFYELSEVHTLVGNVVEDGLVAVALIFDIADFHLQPEVFRYLAALNHGAMLARLGIVPCGDVLVTGNAVDALDVVHGLQVGFLHLQIDKLSGESHHAYVMSRIRLNSHKVALMQVKSVDIVVVAFPCVLELHFHKVRALRVSRHVRQPVVGVQLMVLPSDAFCRESAVALS